MATLYELSSTMLEIEQCLIENGGELTPELESLLQDTENSITAKADGYRNVIAKFDSVVDACKKEEDRIKKIKKTAENSKRRIQEHVLNVMGAYGLKSLKGSLCTFTRYETESLQIAEELLLKRFANRIARLQDQMGDIFTVEIKVNRTKIKEAFKESGILPAGCEFVKNESLRIK